MVRSLPKPTSPSPEAPSPRSSGACIAPSSSHSCSDVRGGSVFVMSATGGVRLAIRTPNCANHAATRSVARVSSVSFPRVKGPGIWICPSNPARLPSGQAAQNDEPPDNNPMPRDQQDLAAATGWWASAPSMNARDRRRKPVEESTPSAQKCRETANQGGGQRPALHRRAKSSEGHIRVDI